jgi:hypothetical protein
MSSHEQCRIDMLIFAIDPSMQGIVPQFVDPLAHHQRAEDRAVRLVESAGDALRLMHRHQPRLLLVWVDRERLDESAALIDALRRRRPELPLLAITLEHNSDIERAVRTAGAGYYFALDGDPDPPLLRQTLAALGFSRAPVPPGAGPPRTGPPRIRGRPQGVFRSP